MQTHIPFPGKLSSEASDFHLGMASPGHTLTNHIVLFNFILTLWNWTFLVLALKGSISFVVVVFEVAGSVGCK
jgi:hypothetical protein